MERGCIGIYGNFSGNFGKPFAVAHWSRVHRSRLEAKIACIRSSDVMLSMKRACHAMDCLTPN